MNTTTAPLFRNLFDDHIEHYEAGNDYVSLYSETSPSGTPVHLVVIGVSWLGSVFKEDYTTYPTLEKAQAAFDEYATKSGIRRDYLHDIGKRCGQCPPCIVGL